MCPRNNLDYACGASITTVSKQTPANAKMLAAAQRTLNQMSSKFCLHTQNKSLPIRSRTRTIRTGVTTTTSSEIAHETAKCLVRTMPTFTTPGSFRNFLRIVSAIRYSGQETNFPIAFFLNIGSYTKGNTDTNVICPNV